MEKTLADFSETNEVLSFKLDSSEEIVAEIRKVENGFIMVKNPLLLVLHSKENQGYVSLVPWTFSNNKNSTQLIPINLQKIVSFFEPDNEMKEKYYQ